VIGGGIIMEKTIIENKTVADIVVRCPAARAVFEQLGIDYYCGGKQELKTAAQNAGLTVEQLTDALTEAVNAPAARETDLKDWTAESLTELISHIKQHHHTFMREQLPRLTGLLEKVFGVHKERHGQTLASLGNVLAGLRSDIEIHLVKEEQILFPYIRQIEAYAQGRGPSPQIRCGGIQNPIRQMEYEHKEVAAALTQVHRLTDDFTLPTDACSSFRARWTQRPRSRPP
jgi:regulator of cell morphogenesis and NO signaling